MLANDTCSGSSGEWELRGIVSARVSPVPGRVKAKAVTWPGSDVVSRARRLIITPAARLSSALFAARVASRRQRVFVTIPGNIQIGLFGGFLDRSITKANSSSAAMPADAAVFQG